MQKINHFSTSYSYAMHLMSRCSRVQCANSSYILLYVMVGYAVYIFGLVIETCEWISSF